MLFFCIPNSFVLCSSELEAQASLSYQMVGFRCPSVRVSHTYNKFDLLLGTTNFPLGGWAEELKKYFLSDLKSEMAALVFGHIFHSLRIAVCKDTRHLKNSFPTGSFTFSNDYWFKMSSLIWLVETFSIYLRNWCIWSHQTCQT